jgi:8-oxo-dGTP diphosphatase
MNARTSNRIVNGLLTRDGRVLLARRSATKRHYPNTWSFPGGHVETGETDRVALARELREELGITPSRYTYIQQITDPDPSTVYQMFHVTAWVGDPTITNDEHDQIAWFTATEACALPNLALPVYRELIQTVLATTVGGHA